MVKKQDKNAIFIPETIPFHPAETKIHQEIYFKRKNERIFIVFDHLQDEEWSYAIGTCNNQKIRCTVNEANVIRNIADAILSLNAGMPCLNQL